MTLNSRGIVSLSSSKEPRLTDIQKSIVMGDAARIHRICDGIGFTDDDFLALSRCTDLVAAKAVLTEMLGSKGTSFEKIPFKKAALQAVKDCPELALMYLRRIKTDWFYDSIFYSASNQKWFNEMLAAALSEEKPNDEIIESIRAKQYGTQPFLKVDLDLIKKLLAADQSDIISKVVKYVKDADLLRLLEPKALQSTQDQEEKGQQLRLNRSHQALLVGFLKGRAPGSTEKRDDFLNLVTKACKTGDVDLLKFYLQPLVVGGIVNPGLHTFDRHFTRWHLTSRIEDAVQNLPIAQSYPLVQFCLATCREPLQRGSLSECLRVQAVKNKDLEMLFYLTVYRINDSSISRVIPYQDLPELSVVIQFMSQLSEKNLRGYACYFPLPELAKRALEQDLLVKFVTTFLDSCLRPGEGPSAKPKLVFYGNHGLTRVWVDSIAPVLAQYISADSHPRVNRDQLKYLQDLDGIKPSNFQGASWEVESHFQSALAQRHQKYIDEIVNFGLPTADKCLTLASKNLGEANDLFSQAYARIKVAISECDLSIRWLNYGLVKAKDDARVPEILTKLNTFRADFEKNIALIRANPEVNELYSALERSFMALDLDTLSKAQILSAAGVGAHGLFASASSLSTAHGQIECKEVPQADAGDQIEPDIFNSKLH